MGLEYRRQFWSGDLSINTTFTQEELFDGDGNTLGDDRFRYSAFAEGQFDINEDWIWGFGVERTYDDDYLRRYDIDGAGERRGPYVGHDTRLISQLYGIGQTRHSYTSVSFVGIQDLADYPPMSAVVQPVIAPYFETEHVMRDPLVGGQLRVNLNSAILLRNDDAVIPGFEGNNGRLSLSGSWRKDMIFGPGMVLSPFGQVRGDLFHVEAASDDYETFGRTVGLVGTEVSWPFMRAGERFDFIVEPVVMAAYGSNDAEDPRIINEDSLSFELDDSNLFRPNAAANYDLWEPGGRVSVGMRATARARSGESASLLFGRRWRDEQAVGFTQQNNLAGETSDWVVAAQADLGRPFGAEARLRLDDENLEIRRIDLGVRAALGRFSAGARYFTIDDDLVANPNDPNSEISGSIGVDLARGWRAQFGLTRDLDSDINLRQEVRAIYEDDCTYLEIAYTRTETRRGTIGPDEGLQIRIGLRSLGVFGGS
ncbi:MAG: LPS assembly protein LptD [Hyphomonadaceae bacterium]